jgi:type VI secretion system secreted protein Hcp
MAVPSFVCIHVGGEVQEGKEIKVGGGICITDGCGSPESVGNMAIANHLDESRIIEWSQKVQVPTEYSSGNPSGVRVHGPCCFTKLTDKSTPLLYQALNDSETLCAQFSFYRVAGVGPQELFYRVTLGEGQVTSMETIQYDTLNPKLDQYMQLDRVSLSFASIYYEHTIAATQSEDHFKTQGEQD